MDDETFDGRYTDELDERIAAAGFQCMGLDFTRSDDWYLVVFKRGPWVIRIRQFADRFSVAAFDQQGFSCPLVEALGEPKR